MEVTAIAPWFGSNRMLAENVGRELRGLPWVGVVFAGGMSELAHIDARTLMVNDLHRHVINLAWVMADNELGPKLYRRLRRIPFHPRELTDCQCACSIAMDDPLAMSREERLEWAVSYFVAAWMPRHGSSGTDREFEAQMSIRWNANGGDSAKHYWSAVKSINAWRRVLRRANFTVLDFRDFLAKCKDQPDIGIYCDPPFFGPGDKYAHKMTERDHRDLAAILTAYKQSRIVCRFYDTLFVRELYSEGWRWKFLEGRKQTNELAPEVLLVRN